MIIYYAIIFCLAINAFFNKTKNNRAWITYFIFIILFAMRGPIGTDWEGYKLYYDNVNNYQVIWRFKFEPGYYLLNKVFSFFHVPYWGMVFVITLVVGFILYKAIGKLTENAGIAILLSSYYFFYPSIEALRQSIALALFAYSLNALNENDDKKYIILNIIGMLFHRMSILTLIFYAFKKFKVGKIIISVSFLSFYVLQPLLLKVLTYFPVLYQKYIFYVSPDVGSILNFHITVRMVEVLLLLFIYWAIKRIRFNRISITQPMVEDVQSHAAQEKTAIDLLLFALLINIVFNNVGSISYRMIYYCDWGIILLYSYLFDYFENEKSRFFYIVYLGLNILVKFYAILSQNQEIFDIWFK